MVDGRLKVVGHDWGGMMVAWVLAAQRPELVKTLSVLNAPHPSVFDSLIRSDPEEQKRSSYQLYFDTHAADTMDTSAFFAKESWWDPETAAAYRAAYASAGAVEAGLNWYRQNIFAGQLNVKQFTAKMPTNLPKNMTVATPTLVLWGLKDSAFDNARCLAGLDRFVPRLTIKTKGYENVSHWIAQEVPTRVARDIASFISE